MLVLMAAVGSTAGRVVGRLLRVIRDRSGGPMVETVVALSVFIAVGTSVLLGIRTIQTSGNSTEGRAVAENIARNQMAHIFSLSYQDATSTYPSIADVPTDYTVTAVANEFLSGDVDIQKIVVTVTRGGRSLLVLETLRAR
ncbi:MAG: hypothetical protein IH956_03355 [Chloroflexi bacterium]|nr:hypothetical protein [Chloroflexota bacterium]